MINTLFDSIIFTIKNSKLNSDRHYFHWSFPRQSGVTTMLANYARTLCMDGKDVLYVAHSRDMLRNIEYNILKGPFGCPVTSAGIMNSRDFEMSQIRGKSRYDYILIDTCVLNDHVRRQLSLGLWADTVIHIDTTEG